MQYDFSAVQNIDVKTSHYQKKTMKNFKYDVVKLIQSVCERPCLWDKTVEVYKDRIERRAAWEEIFSILDENYEHMTLEEKRVTGEKILNKWTNLRDTFVKSLKTKMGKPKRRYLYHDHLKFLIKVLTEDEYSNTELNNFDDNSVSYLKQELEEEPSTSKHKKRSKKVDYTEEEYVPSTSKKSKKPETSSKTYEESLDSYEETDDYNIDHVDINEDARGDPRIMNEDEAFFASLLPTVVKYSEDERLEFRIEVLDAMKKIKDKRRRVEGNF